MPFTNHVLIKVKVVLSNVLSADFEPILREHIIRPYQLRDELMQEAWRRLPEIPSGREMTADFLSHVAHAESLPENTMEGPWESKESYIGSQYQLLRYDATYPLRDSIRSYKENPGTSDLPTTSIYTNVRCLYFLLEPSLRRTGLYCGVYICKYGCCGTYRVLDGACR